MTAEIITIGDEILIGQIVDSNSAFIAQELDKIGVSVYQITSIQDEQEHILHALQEASTRVDIILITGGLGPTKDDLTKDALCAYFSDKLIPNNAALKHIEELFSKRKNLLVSQLNRDQAMVPSKATVLPNKLGTAPGLWMEKDNKLYVIMPGVPHEMKGLMGNQVLPRIQEKYKRPYILHKTILVKGIPESILAEKLESWEDKLPSILKLAYLPNSGTVRLRLSGKGEDEQQLRNAIEQEFEKIYGLLGSAFQRQEEETIVMQINKILSSQGFSLAVAESCTGGSLAAAFTSQPGASQCFKGGVVSYATQAKIDVLQVPSEVIEKYSVVSAEVAESMAENTKKVFQSDFALATTGNAGPTKGDSTAEVGTVFIGLATPEKVISKKFMLGNNRDEVVKKTVYKAFEMILEKIKIKPTD